MTNSPYGTLKQHAENGGTILLDGAIGTQLQRLGVPMDNTAWAATALASHPQVVLQMHQQYLEAGADIITTNTFSSARHNLEPIGLGARTLELNRLAVTLAQQARDRFASARPVAIAGSVSQFGILVDGEPVGRMIILQNGKEIRIADLAIDAAHRRKGIATAAIQGNIGEAIQSKRALRLHVAKFGDEDAARLYTRLGFVPIEDRGSHWFMEWRPGSGRPS